MILLSRIVQQVSFRPYASKFFENGSINVRRVSN